MLDSAIPRDSLKQISERYYRDLGADLTSLGVLYDLDLVQARLRSPIPICCAAVAW